jgi:hypothetical protein
MLLKKLVAASLTVCSVARMTPRTLKAQLTLNNNAVIKSVKAGLSIGRILSIIHFRPEPDFGHTKTTEQSDVLVFTE